MAIQNGTDPFKTFIRNKIEESQKKTGAEDFPIVIRHCQVFLPGSRMGLRAGIRRETPTEFSVQREYRK
jgi:hypothetical protein